MTNNNNNLKPSPVGSGTPGKLGGDAEKGKKFYCFSNQKKFISLSVLSQNFLGAFLTSSNLPKPRLFIKPWTSLQPLWEPSTTLEGMSVIVSGNCKCMSLFHHRIQEKMHPEPSSRFGRLKSPSISNLSTS